MARTPPENIFCSFHVFPGGRAGTVRGGLGGGAGARRSEGFADGCCPRLARGPPCRGQRAVSQGCAPGGDFGRPGGGLPMVQRQAPRLGPQPNCGGARETGTAAGGTRPARRPPVHPRAGPGRSGHAPPPLSAAACRRCPENSHPQNNWPVRALIAGSSSAQPTGLGAGGENGSALWNLEPGPGRRTEGKFSPVANGRKMPCPPLKRRNTAVAP